MMRTTITLDEDVSSLLKRIHRKEKRRLKEIINDLLRQALFQRVRSPTKSARYRLKSVSVRESFMENFDNVSDVLSAVEGDSHR